ncbi:MAG: flexitail domain-containing putative surface protein [Dehalococcoidia bacterium]
MNRHRTGVLLLVAIGGAIAALLAMPSVQSASVTQRVSVTSGGVEATRPSQMASISDDGRYVAFMSEAPLVPDDTMNIRDIYVHDRLTGATERVSVATNGTQGNGQSLYPAISGNGCCIAFQSEASNLAPSDSGLHTDIFVRDRIAGTTERITVLSTGDEAQGNSSTPTISGDGRYVAFTSLAANLVSNDPLNTYDVFVYDRVTKEFELVSQATDGTHGNFASGGIGAGKGQISADARYVAFGSAATNLVPKDNSPFDDVFLRDRTLKTTELLSFGAGGEAGDGHSLYPDVSDNGQLVVFVSSATVLVDDDGNHLSDVFLHNVQSGATTRINKGPGGVEADGASAFPTISGDGRVVAFQSAATNLVSNDGNQKQDIFVYYAETGEIRRANVAGNGAETDGQSAFPAISGLGADVAFESLATNLVPNDANQKADVFARSAPPPGPDSDGDGCADAVEGAFQQTFGGRRDANYFWDFFDTPDATNLRDRVVSAGDILRIVLRFGTAGDAGIDPLSMAPASGYHTAFDRSPPASGADAWDLGPPDGHIATNDILFIVGQFGHSCA